jgi:energy-converting hydrogenase Eha subunit A
MYYVLYKLSTGTIGAIVGIGGLNALPIDLSYDPSIGFPNTPVILVCAFGENGTGAPVGFTTVYGVFPGVVALTIAALLASIYSEEL